MAARRKSRGKFQRLPFKTARQRLQSILLDALSYDNEYSAQAFHRPHVTDKLPCPPISDSPPHHLSSQSIRQP